MMSAIFLFLAAAAAPPPTPITPASVWPPATIHQTLRLWPGPSPDEPANMLSRRESITTSPRRVAGQPILRLGNVSTPTLTLYKARSKSSAPAIIVLPGGGYGILAINLEGTEVCQWLNSIGVTCILIKYRVPGSGPYPKSALALEDAQRAMGLVHLHSADWGIDPHRIGVLGFSAGGDLAALLSNHFAKRLYAPIDAADNLSCRPDFTALIYPGYLVVADREFSLDPAVQPSADSPPTFLVQTEDDPVHVENALTYFMALKKAGVPAELHVYAKGGHGYGLRRTSLSVTTWPQAMEIWLHTIHVLTVSAADGHPSLRPPLHTCN